MARMMTTANTHADLTAWLGTKDSRKMSHNTYAERRGEDIAVRLHATDIMTFHADETITLNSGGWRTVTTKDRINAVLPAPLGVYSSDGVWTLSRRGNAPGFVSEFYDGMRFDRHGNMVTDVLTDTGRELKRIKRDITRYVKLYTAERIAELVTDARENGTGGDCWGCAMGVPLSGHLEEHVREGYTMASLMVNALKHVGYRDPGMILAIDRDGSMIRRAIRRMMVEKMTTSHGARPERDGLAQHWAGKS